MISKTSGEIMILAAVLALQAVSVEVDMVSTIDAQEDATR